MEGDRVIVEGTGKERIDLIKRIDYRISEIASTIPVPEFVADTLEGEAPLSVKFIDQSINAASWEWDFDSDGQIDATEQHPSYTYTDPGEYTVTPVNDNYNYPLTTIINAQFLLITFLFFIIFVTPNGNGNRKLTTCGK